MRGVFSRLVLGCMLAALVVLLSGVHTTASAAIAVRTGSAPIPRPYMKIFEACAKKNNVDVLFMASVFTAGEHGGRWPDIRSRWASSHMGAKGPWQFIDSTWSSFGRDGDGDGDRDVQSVWDASCGAASYLASAGARGVYGASDGALNAYANAASIYNSGQPASVGYGYYETRPYILSVVRTYKVFYVYYKKHGRRIKEAGGISAKYIPDPLRIELGLRPEPELANEVPSTSSWGYGYIVIALVAVIGLAVVSNRMYAIKRRRHRPAYYGFWRK